MTPDGKILDIFGPENLWQASLSDADILKELMKLEEFKTSFKPGDIFVIDRGFRDVKEQLENQGYIVKIPPHRAPRQKQLTTVQANEQRDCTAVRWIIEVINRRLKCNRYLSRNLGIRAVPHLLEDTRIAAAIHNAFGSTIYAYSDDASVTQRIKGRRNLENKLQKFVETKKLRQQTVAFQKMDGSSIADFPDIDPIALRTLLGSYNIALAKSYYADHIEGKSGYEIQVGKDEKFNRDDFYQFNMQVQRPLFIRVKLQSRHSRTRTYQAYLLCDLDEETIDKIIGFYCTCTQGARSVSPCAHVASVIWFLGYGRHQLGIKTPSEFLNQHFPAGKPENTKQDLNQELPVAESEDEDNEE